MRKVQLILFLKDRNSESFPSTFDQRSTSFKSTSKNNVNPFFSQMRLDKSCKFHQAHIFDGFHKGFPFARGLRLSTINFSRSSTE